MDYAIQHKSELIRLYVQEKKSTHEIAEILNTYPNKVLRALKALGVRIREYSETSKLSLKQGRRKHPTKGTAHSDSTKEKISVERAKIWKNLTEQERLDIIDQRRETWEKIPEEKREEMRIKATQGIQRASKEGSLLEKFLHEALIDAGYDCHHHKKILENEKLEVDLLIPSILVAIEVDGPAHYLPIWGPENLKQHIKADGQKNGLLNARGYHVIRLRNKKHSLSQSYKKQVLNLVITTLKHLEQEPTVSTIYLEI